MRHASPDDCETIRKLLDLAFAPSTFESHLVARLIAVDAQISHWIVKQSGNVIAYACYSLAYRQERPIGWHLAPVAVHPAWQKQGYGSDLIQKTLSISPISESPVFVLGDPVYYMRFGFRRVREPRCPFDPTSEHFMALRYTGRAPFVIGYEKHFFDAEADTPTNAG